MMETLGMDGINEIHLERGGDVSEKKKICGERRRSRPCENNKKVKPIPSIFEVPFRTVEPHPNNF
jgi:hypothetical protein